MKNRTPLTLKNGIQLSSTDHFVYGYLVYYLFAELCEDRYNGPHYTANDEGAFTFLGIVHNELVRELYVAEQVDQYTELMRKVCQDAILSFIKISPSMVDRVYSGLLTMEQAFPEFKRVVKEHLK
jgi:hypothetical protein